MPTDTATASINGVVSEAAVAAIEMLLERSLPLPEPSEDARRRHYATHRNGYSTGERVSVRHILFAVTPGVDVTALRQYLRLLAAEAAIEGVTLATAESPLLQ